MIATQERPMAKKQTKPLPRETTLGPTPETMRHGDYVRPEGRGALEVYTNRRANYLGRLLGNGSVTPKQASAGYSFIETYHQVWGTPSRRDSTQPHISGQTHETAEVADRMARRRARLNTILNRIGPGRYSLLVSVCIFDEPIGPDRGKGKVLHALLGESLDQCAIVYGVEE
jgi:hypothetical protein